MRTETMISRFCRKQGADIRRYLRGYLRGLRNEILKRAGEKNGRSMCEGKVAELRYVMDLDGLDKIYEGTAKETIDNQILKSEFGFVFGDRDIESLKAMKNNFFWMMGEHEKKIQGDLKWIIGQAFDGEIPRLDLAKVLQEEFSGIVKREMTYFQDVSDHIIRQNQNIARVNQGDKYGALFYKILARMDDRTTQFCASMNGRVIPAGHLRRQIRAIERAQSIGEKKLAAEWISKDRGVEELYGGVLPKGIGLPPYHFRCRTAARPVWDVDFNQVIPGESEPLTSRTYTQAEKSHKNAVMSWIVNGARMIAEYESQLKYVSGAAAERMKDMLQKMRDNRLIATGILADMNTGGNIVMVQAGLGEYAAAGTFVVKKEYLVIDFLAANPERLVDMSGGAGKAAVLEMVRASIDKGCGGRLRLVSLRSAKGFYEKLGFKEDGVYMELGKMAAEKLLENAEKAKGLLKKAEEAGLSWEEQVDAAELEAMYGTGGVFAVKAEGQTQTDTDGNTDGGE